MKKTLFFLIIIIQLSYISYLGIKIVDNKKNTLGTVNLNPIKKDYIISSPGSELKYFYEPKSNSVTTDAEWVNLYKDGEYKTNTDGLRERFDYPVSSNDKTFRIITLGDSFTWSLFVEVENIWPEVLEKSLNSLNCSKINKFEVINLAMAGYDLQYSLERYKLRGQKYHPDLIIWLIKDDDFTELNEIMYIKMNGIEKNMKKSGEYQALVEDGVPFPAYGKTKEVMTDIYNKNEEVIIKRQVSYLNELFDYFNKRLLITALFDPQDKYKKALKEFKNSRPNIYYFDKIRNFYLVNGSFTPKDWHPNKLGHKIIAEDLSNYLTKTKLIPCK